MDIVVCIKRVPDIPGPVQIDASANDIKRDTLIFKINDWDEYALEEAAQLKEKLGGTFTAITVGPKECDDILRRALALGADRAIRIDEDVTAKDSYTVAKLLSTLISSLSYDLVMFGMQSEDLGRGQLGPMVAEMLGIPHAAGVTRLEVRDREVGVGRELEGGTLELYALKLPALLTIQTGINIPRYVSVSSIRRARDKELRVMALDELGLSRDTLTPIVKLENLDLPPKGKEAEIISGSPEETAEKLAALLKSLGAF